LPRCPWPGQDARRHHDDEWGVPNRALYGARRLQAGAGDAILRKRDNFRRAFDGFAPEKIARYSPKKIERLMADAGIVRNRLKIAGAVASARAWLDVMEQGPGFSRLLWNFVDGTPKCNSFRTIKQVPAETALSRAISKELAGRGFKFVGPTIVYAFMQATGMVNDHLVSCHRHARLRQAFEGVEGMPPRPKPHARTPRGRAAHALRPKAPICSTPRPRHRDRGHRARARPLARWNRADRRARTSIRSRSIRCWSADRIRARRSTAAAGWRCCCTTHPNT
jgi:DNA-3-methyladenine glycosylase I